MRGLLNFVKDIKTAPSKDAEDARIQFELHKIREKFAQKSLSGYDRRKYVWKLIYIYMLGYNVDFGHMEAIKLVSSESFQEKKTGYIACSLMLLDQPDVLSLITNILKNDLTSYASTPYVSALALNAIANIGSPEYASNLFNDVMKIANESSAADFVRRRAYIAMLRLFRRDPKLISLPQLVPKITRVWETESEIGVLISLSAFMVGVLEAGNVQAWQGIYEPVVECLHRVLAVGGQVAVFLYYRVPCPWLLVKLLRILQFFPPPSNNDLKTKVHNCLTTSLNAAYLVASDGPSAVRGFEETKIKNRLHAELMVCFEACSLICHLGHQHVPRPLSLLLGQRLIQALEHRDVNVRYLALDVIARLSPTHLATTGLKEMQNVFQSACKDQDSAIRRMARNVIFAFSDESNWRSVVDDFLEQLKNTQESEVQEELSLKIAVLVEKYSLDFKAYVDVLFKIFEYAPQAVSPDVGHRFIQILIGFDTPKNLSRGQSTNARAGDSDLQRDAARRAAEILENGSSLHQHMPHAAILSSVGGSGSKSLLAVGASGGADSAAQSPHRLAALLGVDTQSSAGVGGLAKKNSAGSISSTSASKTEISVATGYVPDELYCLAAYILGEFGHTIAQEVGVGKQLTILTQHRSLLVKPSALCVMILSVAKIASGYLATQVQNSGGRLEGKADSVLERVLSLFEDYQTHIDPELQQRAIEFHALLSSATKSSSSSLQALNNIQHALGLMPPFASSIQANNPLLARMKDLQTSKKRAVDRANLEILAQTEGRTITAAHNSSNPNAASSQMSLNPDKAKKGGASGQVVGGRGVSKDVSLRRVEGVSAGGNANKSLDAEDGEKRRNADSENEQQNEEEEDDHYDEDDEDDEESEDDEDDDSDDDEENTTTSGNNQNASQEQRVLPFSLPSPKSPTDADTLWRVLCLLPSHLASSNSPPQQRLLYSAGPLRICVSQDYKGANGRIQVEYTNTHSQHSIPIASVQVQPPASSGRPALEIVKSTTPPTSIPPSTTIQHVVDVSCNTPFVTPPKYLVTLAPCPQLGINQNVSLPFSLPTVITKFMTPTPMTPENFVKYWSEFGKMPAVAANGDVKAQGSNSLLPAPAPSDVAQTVRRLRQEISGLISSGCHLSLISSVDMPANGQSIVGSAICAAGTFCTNTMMPNQPNKPLVVACMVKIDIDPRSGSLVMISCRAAHHAVADALVKVIGSFIISASSSAAGGNTQPQIGGR